MIDPLVEAFEDEKKLERMQDPINMLQAMTLLGKVASKVFSKKIFQIEKDDVDLVFEPYAKELSILKAMEMFLASRYHLVHDAASSILTAKSRKSSRNPISSGFYR